MDDRRESPGVGRILRPAWMWVIGLCLGVGWVSGPVWAGAVEVPNASFESPATLYATADIVSWQKKGKPPDLTEIDGFPWEWRTGVFLNEDPGSALHIVNCDGAQAAFLFNVPQVALFQDYGTFGFGESAPSHAFDVRYRVGHGYRMTVGVIGGGGGMREGSPLRLELYYRDADTNRVTVAYTDVVHAQAVFPTNTEFIDFEVEVPAVGADDPWAGERIGIILISMVDVSMWGGYWDLDNVRLAEIPPFEVGGMEVSSGEVWMAIDGEAGAVMQIEAASELGPAADWTVIGRVTNETGSASFVDPAAGDLRLYRARQLP